MEFFNKKEEVIEIVLTQKGRELYSQGKFKPVYYSFHDTGITYDNASGEEQNDIVPRIKDTPTLKSIVGLQNPIASFIDYASNKNKQKEFVLKNEIGSKTLGDQYAPSWNLKFLKTPPFQWYGTSRDQITDNKKYQLNFSSSIDFDKSSQELIPQFNIQTLYQVYDVDDLTQNKFSIQFPKQDYSLSGFYSFVAKELGTKVSSSDKPFIQFIPKKVKKKFGFSEIEVIEYDTIITPTNLFGFPSEEKEIFGSKIKTYKIFNKSLKMDLFFSISQFEQELKNLYDASIFVLTKLFNELFPLQLQTTEEFVKLMKDGFSTDYNYDYEQIKQLSKSLMNVSFIIDTFKMSSIDGINVEFYNSKDQAIKMQIPKYDILKSMWLVRDPKLLIDFQELNAYETNEESLYELKYYEILNNSGLYKKLNTDEIREYVSISFDSVADLENKQLTRNIYDTNSADDTTC